MKISQLIRELKEIKQQEGDIEVTCTGSATDDYPDIFETTVETLVIKQPDETFKTKRVRVYL